MMGGALFLVNFGLSALVFSFVIACVIVAMDRDRAHATGELVVHALGLGPALATLVLYYLLLATPGRPDGWYVTGVLVFFGALAVAGRSGARRIATDLAVPVLDWWRSNARSGFTVELTQEGDVVARLSTSVAGEYLFRALCVATALVFLHLYATIVSGPLVGTTDTYQYGAAGKAYGREHRIAYDGVLLSPRTGFYRPSFHAPGFPLLRTFEGMVDRCLTGADKDGFFKGIPAYYGLLIVIVQCYWLRRRGPWLAAIGLVVLYSAFGFYASCIRGELDTYRILFLSLSFVYLARALDRRDRVSTTLLGLTCGLSAFAHSIGAIVAVMCLGLFAAFRDGSVAERVAAVAIAGAGALFGGGLHYVIDVLWGTGWIL